MVLAVTNLLGLGDTGAGLRAASMALQQREFQELQMQIDSNLNKVETSIRF